MVQYIYCIAANMEGPVKVGRSNDPARRLRQLQTGHAGYLTLHRAIEVADDEVGPMERAIHQTIGYRRITGEWFQISVADAVAEIEHAVIALSGNLRERSAADLLGDFADISSSGNILVDETEKPH